MIPETDALQPIGFMNWLQAAYPELYVKCSTFMAGLDDREAMEALRKCVDIETYQYVVDARFEYYHKVKTQ